MSNNKYHKIISLLIAMKRQRRNSVIFLTAYYKLAPQFGLSPQTFKKYLLEAEKLGWIQISGGRITINSLPSILEDFISDSGLYFGKYNVLKSKETSFKDVLSEIESILLMSNIYDRQQYHINKKNQKIKSAKRLSSTEKSKGNRKLSALDKRVISDGLHREKNVKGKLEYNGSVVTSARHTASKLGVSVNKANKILNRGLHFTREIKELWFKGCSHGLFDALRESYPKATILMLGNCGYTKVCFGSVLKLK